MRALLQMANSWVSMNAIHSLKMCLTGETIAFLMSRLCMAECVISVFALNLQWVNIHTFLNRKLVCISLSVLSDSLQPYDPMDYNPLRLLCPWNSPCLKILDCVVIPYSRE